MAQTYLELLRSWTANTSESGRWLFERVGTAGVDVETRLSTAAGPAGAVYKVGQPAQTVGLGTMAYRFGDTRERRDIVTRVSRQTSRGLLVRHFYDIDWLLCFDRYTHEKLQRMQAIAESERPSATVSQIIPLLGGQWRTGLMAGDSGAVRKAGGEMKGLVRQFLVEKLAWEVPVIGIQQGPRRTVQLVLPSKARAFSRDKGAKLRELREKTGCEMRMTFEGRNSDKLLSITGPKEKLEAAEQLVHQYLEKVYA